MFLENYSYVVLKQFFNASGISRSKRFHLNRHEEIPVGKITQIITKQQQQ